MNIQFDKTKLEKIRKKHNLSLVLLHGSGVDGKTHPRSDVDIGVVRREKKSKLDLLGLIKDLSGTISGGDIDLSDLTRADPLFLYSALRKSKLLAGEKKDYDSFLRFAFFRYNDYLPYLKMEEDFVRKRIKSYVSA